VGQFFLSERSGNLLSKLKGVPVLKGADPIMRFEPALSQDTSSSPRAPENLSVSRPFPAASLELTIFEYGSDLFIDDSASILKPFLSARI
jgi:hypothetical protein